MLREAGALTAERRGTWVHYRVEPDVLDRLADQVRAMQAHGSGRLVSAAPPQRAGPA